MYRTPLRLLLIEDEPAYARTVEAACQHELRREHPYARLWLTHATSAASAQRLLATCQFDVILLDLGLPDSTGLATFHRIQAAAPQLPIIVLTSSESDGEASLALRGGAAGCLSKHLTGGPELRAAVEQACKRMPPHGNFDSVQQQLLRLKQRVEELELENHRLRQALTEQNQFSRSRELEEPLFGDVLLNPSLARSLS